LRVDREIDAVAVAQPVTRVVLYVHDVVGLGADERAPHAAEERRLLDDARDRLILLSDESQVLGPQVHVDGAGHGRVERETRAPYRHEVAFGLAAHEA
jgi:hypothetical protein